MVLSRTVSEINGSFSQKSPIFATPCILRPAEGVPLELGISARGQKSFNDGAIRWSKKFSDRFSRLQYRVWRTDRHVAVAKTALCYASRWWLC